MADVSFLSLQVSGPDSLALGEDSIHSLDFTSEPSLDLPDYTAGGLHTAYPPSPPLSASDTFSGALRSLSLKAASRRGGNHIALQPLRSEGGPPTPHHSIFAPHALPNRNGSLSYDSLLNPGSPGGHACPAHPSAGVTSYRSPYLHPGAVGDPPRPPPQSFSPVLGPRPREPSPVRYDNLSRTIMASIQERKDREERERLLRSQADSLFGDSGVYDAPSSYSLQQANVLSEGPRGPALHYGSRDDLVAGPSFRGARNPALQTSVSSLSSVVSRAPRTSSSSLQADLANNNALGPRPGSASQRSPLRQGPPSPPSTPRSPSYMGPKAVAFIHTELQEPPPSLATQRWVLGVLWASPRGAGVWLPMGGPLAENMRVVQEACGHLWGGFPLPWRLLACGGLPSSKNALACPGVWEDLHLEPNTPHLSLVSSDP